MNLEVNLVKVCIIKVIILADIISSYFLSACLSSSQLTTCVCVCVPARARTCILFLGRVLKSVSCQNQ